MTTVTIQIDGAPKAEKWIADAITGYMKIMAESTHAEIRVTTRHAPERSPSQQHQLSDSQTKTSPSPELLAE